MVNASENSPVMKMMGQRQQAQRLMKQFRDDPEKKEYWTAKFKEADDYLREIDESFE